MYSPAAIEKAPAASPARPASTTILLSLAAAGDAGDQGEVRDQAVRGAEDGRPQPAAGDVAVLVLDALVHRSAALHCLVAGRLTVAGHRAASPAVVGVGDAGVRRCGPTLASGVPARAAAGPTRRSRSPRRGTRAGWSRRSAAARGSRWPGRCAAPRSRPGRRCRPRRTARTPGRAPAGTGGPPRPPARRRRRSTAARRGTSGGRWPRRRMSVRPVRRVDLERPRQVGGAAVELLVEPSCRAGRSPGRATMPGASASANGGQRDAAAPAADPGADAAERDGAPDAQAALPDVERVDRVAALAEVRLRAW